MGEVCLGGGCGLQRKLQGEDLPMPLPPAPSRRRCNGDLRGAAVPEDAGMQVTRDGPPHVRLHREGP